MAVRVAAAGGNSNIKEEANVPPVLLTAWRTCGQTVLKKKSSRIPFTSERLRPGQSGPWRGMAGDGSILPSIHTAPPFLIISSEISSVKNF